VSSPERERNRSAGTCDNAIGDCIVDGNIDKLPSDPGVCLNYAASQRACWWLTIACCRAIGAAINRSTAYLCVLLSSTTLIRHRRSIRKQLHDTIPVAAQPRSTRVAESRLL
jgi:hypothetical protein